MTDIKSKSPIGEEKTSVCSSHQETIISPNSEQEPKTEPIDYNRLRHSA